MKTNDAKYRYFIHTDRTWVGRYNKNAQEVYFWNTVDCNWLPSVVPFCVLIKKDGRCKEVSEEEAALFILDF